MNHSYKVNRVDVNLQRFGLMWKIYDMVALRGLDFRLPILEPLPVTLHGEADLLGGSSGTDFLVYARGLDQPRAHRGVCWPAFSLPFSPE